MNSFTPMTSGAEWTSRACKQLPRRMAAIAGFVGLLSVFAPALLSAEQGGQQAEAAARSGNYVLAVQEYQQLVKKSPLSAELWSNLGSVTAMGGDCRMALSALARARSLNPSLFAPWYFSGFCHSQLHQDQTAAKELQRAIQVNSRDANAWYLLAQALGNLDQLGLAFKAIVQSLNLDSTRPEGYYLAGKTALDLAAAHYARLQTTPSASPFVERLEAERDAGQGVWELAISHYQKAIHSAPRDPDIHFALGTAYFRSNRLVEAEAELRKCLELYPEFATPSQTAWAQLRLAVVLARAKKSDEAQQIARSIDPGQFHVKEEFEDALACATLLQQAALAERILGVALQRYPSEPGLTAWKSRMGAHATSLASDDFWITGLTPVGVSVRFTTVARPSAGNFVAAAFPAPIGYRKFRDAFLRSDFLAVATTVASTVENVPGDAAQSFVFGEIFHWLSVEFYQRLGTAFPDSEPAQLLAAENFASAGQSEQAIRIFRALLEKDPSSPDVLRALAKVYWTQARWNEALQIFDSLLKLDPYDSTTLVNVGRIYSYRQDLETAARNFRRATELDVKMFEAHLGLGETLRRQGNAQAARDELTIAATIEPNQPRPHYALSQIYRKLDQRQLAAAEMRTFQRLQAQPGAGKSRVDHRFVPVE